METKEASTVELTSRKKEAAKRMIEEAIILQETQDAWRTTAPENIDTAKTMSHEVGFNLCYILKDRTNKRGYTDWGSKLSEISSLLKNILVLLAKPGILEKLPESNRETAADTLNDIVTFFNDISDSDYTKEWLDWMHVDQFDVPVQEVERLLKYYDFSRAEIAEEPNCFFDYPLTDTRFVHMKKMFNQLRHL